MGCKQKGKKALKLILTLSMCVIMLMQDVSAFAETTELPSTKPIAVETHEISTLSEIDTPTEKSAPSVMSNEENTEDNKQPTASGNSNGTDIQDDATDGRLDITENNTLSAPTENCDNEEKEKLSSNQTSDIDKLEIAAQQSIDTLPDTTAEDFAVTAENVDEYKAQLDAADDAIGAYMRAVGKDDRLDLSKYDSLSATIESYDDDVTQATENAPLYRTESAETLKLKAQQSIDELPDVTAEDFAVTAENVDEYKAQLVAASDAIAAYMQAGGTDDQLDFARYDALSTAIGDFDGGVAATTEKMTFREYLISKLEGNGITVAAGISDDALNVLIKNNTSVFLNVAIPTDTILDLNYLPNLFTALGSYNACTVTVPKEFSYEYIHTIFPAGTNGGRNKKIHIQHPIYNIIDPYFETKGIDFVPAPVDLVIETEPLEYVDAIPAIYYLPVLPVFHDKNEYDVCVAVEGVDDPVDKGVTVTRDETTIKVETNTDFYCSLLADPSDPFTIRTTYSIKLYSMVGADGKDLSQNGCSPIVMTPINVKYSVSLEPITAGAKDGTPALTGYDNNAGAKYPAYSQYPGEASPGRALNNTTNINRGMNAASDSIGSNSNGSDIRGISNGDGTFSSGTYTAGSGSDPDKIAEEKIFAGTVNGTRTTGFAKYGTKGLTVANNADTGYVVDYYEAQIFHPVTGDAVGWVQKDGTVGTEKTKLTEEQMNSYLSNTGISGKTKIYVAYKVAASFSKTDDKGNLLTAALVGAQNLPSFVLYSDAACTQYATDSDMNGTATKDENTFNYDQTSGIVSSPSIPNLSTTEGTSKTYYFKEIAPGFAEDGKVYTLVIDKDGKVTFNTSEGFIKTGETYSLPNTPLPVNLNFQAATTLDGKTDKFVAEQFKFMMKQTAAPVGVTKFIPDSGIELYNKADGSIDFDRVLTFLTPGNYTFTLKEDTSYRKAGLSDKDYQDLVFDDTERTINVTLRWADINAGDAATENGLKAIISVQNGTEAASVVGSALGKDTNTVSAGTVTLNPISFDTKMKITNAHKALAASTVTKTGDDSPIVQFTILMSAAAIAMFMIAEALNKEKKKIS